MAEERDELLDHNYDGIQEYDNDLPRWWLNIFWLTAIFAVFYTVWTHGWKEPQHEQLARELKELSEMRDKLNKDPSGAEVDRTTELLALVGDQSRVDNGKKLFDEKCAACHGFQGEGLVGPNLTDSHWIHGGEITDILHIIRVGVPDKGMIAWQTMLQRNEMDDLTVYIWTLHGTDPPNAKAAEGELVERDS